MDRPGKDTFRHREAGAHEVLVASGTRWALLHEVAGPEPSLPDLLARMAAGRSGAGGGLQGAPVPQAGGASPGARQAADLAGPAGYRRGCQRRAAAGLRPHVAAAERSRATVALYLDSFSDCAWRLSARRRHSAERHSPAVHGIPVGAIVHAAFRLARPLLCCCPAAATARGGTRRSPPGSTRNMPAGDSENMRGSRASRSTPPPLNPEPGDIWPGPVKPSRRCRSWSNPGADAEPEQPVPGSPLAGHRRHRRRRRRRRSGARQFHAAAVDQPGLAPLPAAAGQPRRRTAAAPPQNGPPARSSTRPSGTGVTTGGTTGYQTMTTPGRRIGDRGAERQRHQHHHQAGRDDGDHPHARS